MKDKDLGGTGLTEGDDSMATSADPSAIAQHTVSLRAYFAAAALQGLIQKFGVAPGDPVVLKTWSSSLADASIVYADALVAYFDECDLLAAAKHLRSRQRDYMADRGNEAKGALVGEAARMLDAAIAKAEGRNE